MLRPFLQAKVHRAVITEANPAYEGSLTLDQNLIDAAGLFPYQRIEVYNVTRAHRFATYLISGERGQGDCCANGAAAHLVEVGDRVIVAAYCELADHEVPDHRPTIVLVGENNTVYEVKRGETAATPVPD